MPSSSLAGRRVTLGVTGSIAAYKSVLLLRLLQQAGADVEVVLTRAARAFVGRHTFSGLTGRPVHVSGWDATRGGEAHVALAARTELLVVAPATADLLARAATGRADDLLTALLLCCHCPVLLAPAMHPSMWSHPATRRNVATLLSDGRITLVGPEHGTVASGDEGEGRMSEPDALLAAVVRALTPPDLAGRHLVITAGPTVEDIDPVRFLSNRSSGKMGFALAERAAARGARVTLLAGPVALSTPRGVQRVDVRGALQLEEALAKTLGAGLDAADALVMAAAVGDFRPAVPHTEKLQRSGPFTLELVENPDLLAALGARRTGDRPVLVGFALETGTDASIEERARAKLERKRCDLVVANPAGESLGRETNRAALVTRLGATWLPVQAKPALADAILDVVRDLLGGAVGR